MSESPTSAATVGAALRWGVHGLSWLASLIAGLALVFVMLAVVYDVFSRNFLGSSVRGFVDYVEIVLVLVVFLALAQTQRRREHVTVEAVVNRVTGWRFRLLSVAAALVALLVVTFLAWVTLDLALGSVESREYRVGLAQVPIWPARLAVAAGFILLALEYVVNLFEASVRKPDSERVFEAGQL